MRTLLSFCFLLVMTLTFSNCGTTNTIGEAKGPSTINYNSLADYLNAKGGVQVTGYDESSIRLQIRGISSLKGDTRPFIYIDGVPIGRSYKQANQAVHPNNIRNIRVLSSLSDLAIYGEDGHSGVILIKTRTGKTKSGKG